MSEALYDRLGGEPAVGAAVEIFYRRVLSDPSINDFFESVDMDAQMAKQKAFLTMVFGGPADYSGKDMREAHAHLVGRGLDDEHFDAVLSHLEGTLNELEVPAEMTEEVITIAESVRSDVLSR
jgi:hemoglobin